MHVSTECRRPALHESLCGLANVFRQVMCTFVCGEGCFEYRLNSIGIHKRFKGRKDDPQFDWLSSMRQLSHVPQAHWSRTPGSPGGSCREGVHGSTAAISRREAPGDCAADPPGEARTESSRLLRHCRFSHQIISGYYMF